VRDGLSNLFHLSINLFLLHTRQALQAHFRIALLVLLKARNVLVQRNNWPLQASHSFWCAQWLHQYFWALMISPQASALAPCAFKIKDGTYKTTCYGDAKFSSSWRNVKMSGRLSSKPSIKIETVDCKDVCFINWLISRCTSHVWARSQAMPFLSDLFDVWILQWFFFNQIGNTHSKFSLVNLIRQLGDNNAWAFFVSSISVIARRKRDRDQFGKPSEFPNGHK